MKTDELLLLCSEFSDILRAFPGMELTAALAHVKQAVADYQQRRVPNTSTMQPEPLPAPPPQVPLLDLQPLAAMSSVDLLRHLQTDKKFKYKKDLQSLAEQLGLSYTQRQTMSDLTSMIVKHFDLMRMDAMIRMESTEYLVEVAAT